METLFSPASLDLIRNFVIEMPFPMMLYSSEGKIISISREWARITGYSIDDIPDLRAWTQFAYREKAGEVLSFIDECSKTNRFISNYKFEIWCKDGSKKTLLVNSLPFVTTANPVWHGITAADITGHKHTHETLKVNEEIFSALADSLPHMVWGAAKDGRVTYFNRKILDFLQVPAGRMTEQAWWDSIHPDDRERVSSVWQKSSQNGTEFIEEFRIKNGKDGVYYWHAGHGAPVRDNEDRIVRWYGTCAEIDARKKMDEALRQSERRLFLQASELETLYQTAPVGLCVLDQNHRILKINRLLAELNGRSIDDFRNGIVSELNSGLTSQILPFVDQVFQNGNSLLNSEVITESPAAPGRPRWWIASFSPIRDIYNTIQAVHCFMQDITDRKRAENALRESETLFRNMADNAPVIIWITAPDGNCIYLNRQWCDFTGIRAEDGLGTGWLDSIHPDDRPQVEKAFFTANKEKDIFRCDYRLRKANGSFRWVMDSAAPRQDEKGEFLGYIGSVVDIDDIKAAEQRLSEMNQTLEQRVLMRTIRLEQQTRQLRQLAAQLTQVEQNERKRLAELIHDHLQQFLVAAKIRVTLAGKDSFGRKVRDDLLEAENLLDDAIDISRSLSAELRPPVLYEDGLVAALKWLSKTMRKQYDLNVALELDEKAEPAGEQSKAMLYESARELLFNIVKYAKVKDASLVLCREQEMCRLTVKDEGAGFHVGVIDRNVDGGKGFGLFSIRERLKVMGGDLKIESSPGKGTRVDIFTPVYLKAKPERETPVPLMPPALAASIPGIRAGHGEKGITVVVADDHRIVREGISNLLKEQKGIRVIGQASDGVEAVEKARTLRPNVVIMDLNMPNMNGIEATRLIASEVPSTKVIGLSVHSEEDVAESMYEAGAYAYLNKAGDPKKLIAAVLSCSSSPD